MAWNRLAPVARNAGQRVQAAVSVNALGRVLVRLMLNGAADELAAGRGMADVSAGVDENAGQLLVEFGDTGAFKVVRGGRGGARLYVPAPDWAPQAARSPAPCEIIEAAAGRLVLRLPTDAAWPAAPQKDRKAPAAAAAPPPPAPQTVAVTVGGGAPLDAVEYLKGRGVNARRVAGDRITVDGELKGMPAVLRMVNGQRLEADLPPLELHQIH